MLVAVRGLAGADDLGGVVDVVGDAFSPAQRAQASHALTRTPEEGSGSAVANLAEAHHLCPVVDVVAFTDRHHPTSPGFASHAPESRGMRGSSRGESRWRPTTSLRSLMPRALLVVVAPPRVPRFRMPFPARQRNARSIPEGSSATPTTSPRSLMPLPRLEPPPSVPRLRSVNCCCTADRGGRRRSRLTRQAGWDRCRRPGR